MAQQSFVNPEANGAALLSDIKVDDRGWNISLFTDSKKAQNFRCGHCTSVCCDAVELGCDEHEEDDEVCSYCKKCLNELIESNNKKCPIESHSNPIIVSNRSIRSKILKSNVICPYSSEYKSRCARLLTSNCNVLDTAGAHWSAYDEREGNDAQSARASDHERAAEACEWQGSFKELIKHHLVKCAARNDPYFMYSSEIKRLKQQVLRLQAEFNEQAAKHRQHSQHTMDENGRLKVQLKEQSLSLQLKEKQNVRLQMQISVLSIEHTEKQNNLTQKIIALQDELTVSVRQNKVLQSQVAEQQTLIDAILQGKEEKVDDVEFGNSRTMKKIQRNEDNCMICYAPTSGAKSATLECCNTSLHSECLTEYIRVGLGSNGQRVTLQQLLCPFCRQPMQSKRFSLQQVQQLSDKLTEAALKQLREDGRMNDAAVANVNGEFYDTPAMYGMQLYAFFLCYQCKEPYCYGENQCGVEAQQYTKAATRVCPACRHTNAAKQSALLFRQSRRPNNIRQCPQCKAYTQRVSGCPTMECRCGCIWCWLCGGKFRKDTIYPHIGRNHPNGTEDQYRWD